MQSNTRQDCLAINPVLSADAYAKVLKPKGSANKLGAIRHAQSLLPILPRLIVGRPNPCLCSERVLQYGSSQTEALEELLVRRK